MKIQHQLIIKEASKRGYNIQDVSPMFDSLAVIIEHRSQSELFLNGTPLSLINLRSLNYFDNKQLTKAALSKLGIPHPKSFLFRNPKEVGMEEFFKEGRTYVCKPVNLTEGIGVEMNFKSLEEINGYYKRNREISEVFMLEEQVEGDDLRVQVLGGKIVAACTREPAYVIGDGKKDLNSIIAERRVLVKANNPMNDLIVDRATMDLLKIQNLSLSDIPSEGQKVRLKELANMSQGAVALDITNGLHPIFQTWIDRIVTYLEVDYFAVDFIAIDFEKDPVNQAVVLEINAKPEWLHHTFSEGRQHDLAAMVLDNVFEKK